ncbi:ATP synthase F1 subcomplex gamma subunit [Desulfitobacterium sp. LBE]|uniref:ATP synthase gamma chain n=5 Tax=root TaxID=1 RepID=ATPG_DESHD|nr:MULTISPECIES: ATP synthase F1 subunit gamma [Desulfitobacterium]B8FZ35.1 RecName: Full=ATP synthase gamma chain; AltName: Full=ATP synthase F1 sector gamma subunit; AltName: Full=F-ATPase gamma subunit [Desulfitobacterium hafniense DCB-2]ACL22787.1 ATP synthase F1, gamma subunit [Desulfitobacterium hafniense DCB-2]KTE93889.1 ATP F0F1 synthase subunit gamma [Desulfitobacterium hafniense]MEA5021978.1 ATP synthase F1 subunit gamma [Desulfitobacterium hafniense]TWH59184.1 ATP synthase F1 subcom
MASARDIRRRIRGVRNMQQITKAMKMVAASKLRKAQEKVIAARPYARQLQEVLARLAQDQADVTHPLLMERPVQRVGYIIITSDRGLCGGYNTNLIRMTNSSIAEETHDVRLVAVGRKGRDFYRRGKIETIAEFVGLGDNPSYGQAKEIAQEVIGLYESGELDEVYLLYNEFVSAISQRPTRIKLLPIEKPKQVSNTEYIFEPSAEEILTTLLPKYVETQVFRTLLEGKASEMGAKMTAMGAATDNAKEAIERLTLQLNRARQAAITTEISEIVGGASALE